MISLFIDKRDPGNRLSMTRLIAALFAVAYVVHWSSPLGWPDAFVAFVILFSVGISKAIQTAPAEAVLDAVTGMFGKGTPTQIVGGVPFIPNQWANGSEEGVL